MLENIRETILKWVLAIRESITEEITHGLRGFGKKPMIMANFTTLIVKVKFNV